MSNIIKKENNEIFDFENQVITIFKRDEEVPYFLKPGMFIFKNDSTYGMEVFKVLRIVNENKEGENYESAMVLYVEPIVSRYNTERIRISDIRNYYITDKIDLDELNDMSDKVMRGEVTIDSLVNFKKETNESKELMTIKSQDYYDTMLGNVRNMNNQVELIRGTILNKVNKIKNEISLITGELRKTITKLNKIVFTLSIYAGINEDVIQIIEGIPANYDEPVYLQQDMLFMDEEVGDPTNGGVSYNSTDIFYNWLREHNSHLGYKNYELVLPYSKCVTLMRVRRKPSEIFSKDPWNNHFEIMQEMKTCILIRNGENVYVIHSDMDYSTQLFPKKEEFQKLIDVMNGINNNDRYMRQEDAEDRLNHYRNGMVLIQGLFDRTDLLAPIGTINIINGKDLNNGKVIMNYGTNLIDGDSSEKKFFSWLNSEVVEGDRVLFSSFGGGDFTKDRVVKYYRYNGSVPHGPDVGVYTIEKYENRLSFLYLPSDEVWNEKYHTYKERTKRERVIFCPKYDNYIKIDSFSHRDYEYIHNQLYDRKHRKSYLWLVPLLNNLKTHIEETHRLEEPFTGLLKRDFPDISTETILDYIFWWKNKNKWKRNLTSDDMKAFRMITSRIKRDIKNNTILTYEDLLSELQPND